MNWVSQAMNYLPGVWGAKDKLMSFLRLGREFSPRTEFNDYSGDLQKLKVALSNPALLKVISLQCDLFSLGRITVVDKNGKELKDDPAIQLLQNPNPFQTDRQLLWDFMFWTMLGNSYLYTDSAVVSPSNKLYFLDFSRMEWPRSLEVEQDKLIFSTAKEKSVFDTKIKYKYKDGNSYDVPLNKLIITNDLTNGTGNWFKGPSRIDALVKPLSNVDASLDSKNINTRYSSKFLVSGQADPKDVHKMPMHGDEKTDIETKMNGPKSVHAIKSMIDIKRFVENMAHLELDKSFLADYFIIGMSYNIPRDVLEAYVSSTYENQEKARGSHVSYTLQPKGDDFVNALSKRWGYTQQGKKIVIGWGHLPFMQVFEKEKAAVQEAKARTMRNLLSMNVSLEEINNYLSLNFKTGSIKKDAKQDTSTGA